MGFYCISNKTLYILLIALCLINDEIYRTVLSFLVCGAISYYIADLGVTYMYTTPRKSTAATSCQGYLGHI